MYTVYMGDRWTGRSGGSEERLGTVLVRVTRVARARDSQCDMMYSRVRSADELREDGEHDSDQKHRQGHSDHQRRLQGNTKTTIIRYYQTHFNTHTRKHRFIIRCKAKRTPETLTIDWLGERTVNSNKLGNVEKACYQLGGCNGCCWCFPRMQRQ